MKKSYLRWPILIAAILVPVSISELKNGSGQENETNVIENEPNKYIDYLQNARNLLNQTSVEYKNSNYTGAEELAIVAYLDNFEYVESELEKKGSHSLMQDIEHIMREELRDLIKNKVNQSELDMHIDAIDAKLLEAINLLKGSK
jgi:GTPase involved in cell partitioning and DNA repair